MVISEVVQILQLGFIGFAFLMASLSFRLLYLEQKRPGNPRGALLASARSYMVYTGALCILVTGARAVDAYVDDMKVVRLQTSHQVRICRDGLSQLENVGLKSADLDSLRREVSASIVGCDKTLTAIVGD